MLRRASQVAQECRFLLGEGHARAVVGQVGRDARLEFGVRYMNGSAISIGSQVEILRDATLDARAEGPLVLHIGDGCRLKENAWLACYGGRIKLGRNVLVGRNSVIHGHGGVDIGEWSMLGSNVTIVSANHAYWQDSVPFQQQGFTLDPVAIGTNVWLGSGSVVLGGIMIEDNVVVGAGSVVTRHLRSGYVYAGNPVRELFPLCRRERPREVFADDPQLQFSHPVTSASRLARLAKSAQAR